MAIAEVFEGGEAVLECSLDSGRFVELSEALYGLSGIDVDAASTLRPIPGGGKIIGSQDLGYEEGVSSCVVDANRRTFPLFHCKAGRRHRWRLYPEGKTTGKPIWAWESLTDVTKTSARRGVVRFSLTLNHDGKIDKSGRVT